MPCHYIICCCLGLRDKLSTPDGVVPSGVNNYRRHLRLQVGGRKGFDGVGGPDAGGLQTDPS